MNRTTLVSMAMAALVLAGCSANPVTGKNQLILQPASWDKKVGAEQFGPARQMQGGDYVTDPGVIRYVNSVGQKLAASSPNPLEYEFTVLNNSVPNAWALPGGKIAVNRGLLTEMQSEAELAAVLGHEVVHAAARHGAQGSTRGMLLQAGVLAAVLATQDKDYSRYAMGGAQLAAQLVHMKYGRGAELESDEYGMKYMAAAGYDPQGAVDLQETFVRLSEGRRSDWISGLFSSHPPSRERVAANRQTAAALGVGGRVGRDDYRRQIRRLLETKEAYKAYDEGREAMGMGRPGQAAELAARAISIEPDEALFYGLQGDAAYKQRDFHKAVRHYSSAVERNPQYFQFHLGRGESYRALGRDGLAEGDLRRSAKLFPTPDALYGLGQIAERRGRTDQAIRYYAEVVGDNLAQSPAMKSVAGRAAYRRMMMLDLGQNPQRYLSVRHREDGDGRVVIDVMNRTAAPVGGVQVEFSYRDGNGRVRQERRRVHNTIPAGNGVTIVLGSHYVPLRSQMRVRVRSAELVHGS